MRPLMLFLPTCQSKSPLYTHLYVDLPVTGLPNLQVSATENFCEAVATFCREHSEPSIASCISQLAASAAPHYEAAHSRYLGANFSAPPEMPVPDAYFCGCRTPCNLAQLGEIPTADLELGRSLTALLDSAISARQSSSLELTAYNSNRRKLTGAPPLARLSHYSAAVRRLPGNKFVLDQLGLSLKSCNRTDTALAVWSAAVTRGIWENAHQRPTSVWEPNLRAQPWWTASELGDKMHAAVLALQTGAKLVRDDLIAYLLEESDRAASDNGTKSLLTYQSEGIHTGGSWNELVMLQHGVWRGGGVRSAFGRTVALLKKIEAGEGVIFNAKLSVLAGGARIEPHCGPSNARLRMHLCVLAADGASILVGGVQKSWKSGKVVVFDDSFEHEVVHEGTRPRVVLIVDVWHPDLAAERRDFEKYRLY